MGTHTMGSNALRVSHLGKRIGSPLHLLRRQQLRAGRVRLCSGEATQDSKGFDPSTMMLGVLPMLTMALGVWQVNRTQWKIELIADRDKRLAMAPFHLNEAPVIQDELDASELDYAKVIVDGVVDVHKAHVPSAMKIGKTVTGYHVIQ